MRQIVDPVATPSAYQQSLLAALGDDDPAEVQRATLAEVRALIDEAGDALRIEPEPGEWSVIECVGHLVDGEIVVAGRLRWILAEDEPDIVGYDQALWVARLHHRDDDPAALLDTFAGLRRANLELWARTPEADRARVGHHRERGPESFELTFRLLAGHDRVHLAQARAALGLARRRR